MRLSRRRGQVTHVLLTRSPLIQNQQKPVPSPFDLHVLSTPPAFVLSQDQTLQTKPTKKPQPTTNSQPEPTVSTTVQKTRPGPTQPPQQRGPGKPKQNKAPTTTHNQNHAQPPGPWHKKHDTLSSSQTTHPAGTRSSLLT